MGLPDESQYSLLPNGSSADEELGTDVKIARSRSTKYRVMLAVIVAESLLIFALFLSTSRRYTPPCQLDGMKCGHLTYSPLQDVVEYETRFFEEVIDRSTSIYSSDPSDEVDRAWSALYNGTHGPHHSAVLAYIRPPDLGMTQISRTEAERLPNKTVPIPADPSQYLMLPTVLHHLHCLNTLRKIIHKDYYANPVTGTLNGLHEQGILNHAGHCLNTIRQAIMCNADISPIVWQWDEEQQQSLISFDIPHTCKKWEPIEVWTREHRLKYEFDASVHVLG
ncbi:hypothetical protein EIP86_008179 [Pleurotus ostreatoroseus]|nr:hypothetical protein EIP86_008179 [Pleurotus ostreatoroseus]